MHADAAVPPVGPLLRLLRRLDPGAKGRSHALLQGVPFDSVGIVLDAGRIRACSRGADRLLGETAVAGGHTARLIALFGEPDTPLRKAVDRLLQRGTGFREMAMLPDGRRVECVGTPHGAACLLTVRVVPSACSSDDAGEAAREALARTALPARMLDARGAELWRNAAATGLTELPPLATLPLGHGIELVLGEPPRPTAPEQTDEVLRRFVETVSETFAHLRVGLAIFDRERRLTLSNPALAEMFQMDPRWLSGRPSLRQTLDRLREARQLPEQADYPAWRATLFTLFDGGGTGSYEDVWELPDQRSLQVVARPHPLGGIAFLFEDITEAVALQRWRSTAVEVRRATLDMLADGVVVLGADGRVRIANPAFVAQWGLDGIDVGALHIADLCRRCGPLCRDMPLWDRLRAAVASAAGRSPWETRVTLTDGRVLKARIAPMPDGSTLAAMADITDSEQVAAALRDRASAFEAAEQMRDTLVDHLSHRLRTPMNAVAGFAEMLAEGRAGALSDTQASFVAHILRAARQLIDGIESLGDLASLQPASNAGAVGAVAIGPAMRGAMALLARRAEEAGVALTLAQSTTEAVVWGDTGRIRQLVYTLVAEGLNAAVRGTTLRIGATAEGETVALWCEGFGSERPLTGPAPGSGITLETLANGSGRLIARMPVRTVRAAV